MPNLYVKLYHRFVCMGKSMIYARLYYLWFQTSLGVLSPKNKGALLNKQQSEDLEFNKQVTGKKGELAEVFEGETNRILDLIGCSD